MARKLCLFAVAGLLIGAPLTGKEVSQSDWHEGPGVLGPVTDWGAGFYESRDVNYFYMWNRLSLAIAAGEPQRHHISNSYSLLDKKIEVAELGGPTNPDSTEIPRPRLDVIVSSLDGLIWFPNKGDGSFLYGRLIYSSGSMFIGYDLADFNYDGAWDVVVSDFGNGEILLYMNDGEGNFTEYSKVATHNGVHQCAAADFDNDGDIDIVVTNHHNPGLGVDTTYWNSPHWYENNGSNIDFSPHEIFNVGKAARRINTGDIDNDGDIDFITSAHHGTYWMENTIREKGPDSAFISHVVQASNRKNLYDWLGDVNRDGCTDILAANLDAHDTYTQWWEGDGTGIFTEHLIGENTNPEGVVSVDIDYDGDVDIIQSYFGPGYAGEDNGKDGFIAWFENVDDDSFVARRFTGYPQSCDLQVADISGNGLLDLVTSTHGPGYSTDWWEMFDHFEPEGELVSSIYDAGSPAFWKSIDWQRDSTKSTYISFKLRATNDLETWPDWRHCEPLTEPGLIEDNVEQNTRYIQYKILMSTTNSDLSPLLYRISINYDDIEQVAEEPVVSTPDIQIVGSRIHYSIPGSEIASLRIFDVGGRALHKHQVCGTGSVDVSWAAPGVYFARLDYELGVLSRRFVLTR